MIEKIVQVAIENTEVKTVTEVVEKLVESKKTNVVEVVNNIVK